MAAAAAAAAGSVASSSKDDAVENVSNSWLPVSHQVFQELVRKMRPSRILDKLFAQEVIEHVEWSRLQSLETEKAKVEELFGVILPKKSPAQDVFRRLCTSLQNTEGQEEVADILIEYAKKPRPVNTPAKTAWVWIPSEDENLAREVENLVAPVFRKMLGTVKECIFPVCRSPPAGGDTAVPLVLSDNFVVRIVLKGVTEAEFAIQSREIFVDLIASMFNVSCAKVESGLKVSSVESVGISLCLPLQNAGLQLISMYRDRCEEIKWIWKFERKMPQLTQINIYIGGLPVWSLPLASSRDGDLDLRVQLNKLARFDCLFPSLLMDEAYDAGIIAANRYLEYTSCEDGRSESKKAVDFISEANEACLESLCNVIKTSESHCLAAHILGLSSTDERERRDDTGTTTSSILVKPKKSLGSYYGLTRRLTSAPVGLYKHVQVYVEETCGHVRERYRNDLFHFFETKFGIRREQWKPDRTIVSSTYSSQSTQRDKNAMVLVCQSYKTIAIEVEQSSLDDTPIQTKASSLRDAFCQALNTSSASVEVRDVFERSGTWVFLSLPLESVFRLMSATIDRLQSKALDRSLSHLLPKASAARMHIGGLPPLSARPIRRISGDWSNTLAAIAIPGYVSHMLVCTSSGAYLVNVESNEVEAVTGDNVDVLRDCSALVSIENKMYAFGSGLYKVTYNRLDSSLRCTQLGDEDWNGTRAACRYENGILVVKRRNIFGWMFSSTNLYCIDVATGASQVLSRLYEPWSVVGALVNVVDNEGKENIIAICGSVWKLDIELHDGVFTHVRSTRLDEVGQNNRLIEGWNCLFEYMHGRGWQFTRSAAVHRNKLYVATGKPYVPGSVLGGLFRVDPFCQGSFSTVYGGWHTIHTVVDVNRYLVVFTTNKFYVLDVD